MVAFASTNTKKRLFNVTQYYAMLEAGILTSEDRLELIHGEIIEISPIGSKHAGYVNKLNRFLNTALQGQVIVSIQNPVRLSKYSEPEPDLAILHPRADFYIESHPTPKEVFFLIEVADTSVGYDYDVKLSLYAAAGIAEVWILDVNEQAITRHLRPDGNVYLDNQAFRNKEVLKCSVLDFELNLETVFS